MKLDQPLRVLMINNQAHALGGAHGVFRNTIELLCRNGVDVQAFTLDDVPGASEQGDRALSGVVPYLYRGAAADAVEKIVAEFRPDIAHIHLFVGGLSASVIAKLSRLGVPIVHTVHDYRLICPANAMLDGKGRICERCKSGVWNCVVQRCSYGSLANSLVVTAEAIVRQRMHLNRLISRYIFVSEFSHRKYAEFDQEFARRGVVIPNFLANDTHIKSPDDKREGFLFFGRLSEEKGLAGLVDAFCKVDLPLTVVGDGPMASVIAGAAAERPNINYLGRKAFPELGEIIASARYCIVPSTWYENNPLAVIEAMSLGTPIIASRIGGLPEMVQPGVNGHLFESGSVDDMLRAVTAAAAETEEEWQRQSDGAREFFDRNYRSDVFLERLIAEYRSVIEASQLAEVGA